VRLFICRNYLFDGDLKMIIEGESNMNNINLFKQHNDLIIISKILARISEVTAPF